jgi:hypothetical protein
METTQAVQELKAERVQQEMVAEEPFRVSLKAERVQEPGVFAPEEQFSSAFELNLNLSQKEELKFELMALGAIVTVG